MGGFLDRLQSKAPAGVEVKMICLRGSILTQLYFNEARLLPLAINFGEKVKEK